jgi:PAS domain S-box-containing protein
MADQRGESKPAFHKFKKQDLVEQAELLHNENQQIKLKMSRLEENMEIYRRMFTEAPDALFLMDSDHKTLSRYNRAAADLFELADEKTALGKPAVNYLKALYSQEALKEINQQLDEKGMWNKEVELKTQQKKTFWGDVSIVRIKLDGRVCQFGRIHDISQKISDRERLAVSEQQFRTLAEYIPGIVYICNVSKDRFMYLNSRTREVLGYAPEQFLNQQIAMGSLVHEEDKAEVDQVINKSVNQLSPYHIEYRIKRQDGSYGWVEDHGTVISREKEVCLQGIILDATRQKNALNALHQENTYLSKLNAELDSFAYSVSHDLRAPINSAMGLLDLLKDDPDGPRRDQFIELSLKSLSKLDDFIQDVIQISRNARAELSLTEIDFERVIREILDGLRFEAEYEKISLRLDIQQPHSFVSDLQRVEVILSNLISNAFRYSDTNKDDPYVSIELASNQLGISCSISDNGVGIEKQHLDEIFKMFYRAHDHIRGSGLGLYLVQETINRLNGKIEVNSEARKGSTFRFYLPNLQ